MARLQEIMEAEPGIEDDDRTDTSIDHVGGSIRFENVSFGYGAADDVLNDISFDVKAGQMLAIVGRTGSGKSTLISMIPRLLDPDSGTVYVGRHDARTVPLEALRASVGFVPQDVFLFNDSIANNISFWQLRSC